MINNQSNQIRKIKPELGVYVLCQLGCWYDACFGKENSGDLNLATRFYRANVLCGYSLWTEKKEKL